MVNKIYTLITLLISTTIIPKSVASLIMQLKNMTSMYLEILEFKELILIAINGQSYGMLK